MQIEIIKFYEIARSDEKQHLVGTLHIRLSEFGINIKGCPVFRKKNFWHFRLPGKRAFDQCLGKEVNYACILFDDREKNEALLTFLKNEGRAFVESYLASIPETSKQPPAPKTSKQASQTKDMDAQKKSQKPEQTKPEPKTSKAQPLTPVAKLAKTEYVDLPPRQVRTNSKFAKR